MSEHHCSKQADASRQPRRTQVRCRIQQTHSEEENAQTFFRQAKATKEPVCDQGIAQQSTAESVEREQSGEFAHYASGGRRDVQIKRASHVQDLDCWRK